MNLKTRFLPDCKKNYRSGLDRKLIGLPAYTIGMRLWINVGHWHLILYIADNVYQGTGYNLYYLPLFIQMFVSPLFNFLWMAIYLIIFVSYKMGGQCQDMDKFTEVQCLQNKCGLFLFPHWFHYLVGNIFVTFLELLSSYLILQMVRSY